MDFKFKTFKMYYGTTDKGSTVTFLYNSMDNIIFLKEAESDQPKATRIDITSNFTINTQMLDYLATSKIIHVEGFTNAKTESKIQVYPLFGFSWEKFTDILHDLSIKFDL